MVLVQIGKGGGAAERYTEAVRLGVRLMGHQRWRE